MTPAHRQAHVCLCCMHRHVAWDRAWDERTWWKRRFASVNFGINCFQLFHWSETVTHCVERDKWWQQRQPVSLKHFKSFYFITTLKTRLQILVTLSSSTVHCAAPGYRTALKMGSWGPNKKLANTKVDTNGPRIGQKITHSRCGTIWVTVWWEAFNLETKKLYIASVTVKQPLLRWLPVKTKENPDSKFVDMFWIC